MKQLMMIRIQRISDGKLGWACRRPLDGDGTSFAELYAWRDLLLNHSGMPVGDYAIIYDSTDADGEELTTDTVTEAAFLSNFTPIG